MLRHFLFLGLVICLGCPLKGADAEKSVIQIATFSQQPVWDAPWRSDAVRKAGGSGFVIQTRRGKRIMTNAHVISWDKEIVVRRYQDPRPYVATVEFTGYDCDLALLIVEDEGFYQGLEPLGFGDLPTVRSTVVTYGYPAGGEQISYTRGVVSRVEMQTYVHIGNRSLLGVQTDAAINPGNSGGPVIQDDRVVGVAFQGLQGLENTGFFIPRPVIDHFLRDVEDGKYDGFPQAGIRLVALQNPAYRHYLKLPETGGGARVDSLLPIPSTESAIKQEDVLLQIGPYAVGSDATMVYAGNRVSCSLAFQEVQSGESVPLKIWREGKEMTVSLPVFYYEGDRAVGNQYGALPRYFVYGGLVFVPLSLDYMKTLGRNWTDPVNADLVYELYYRRHESPETTRPEPIVLASILPSAVNANFAARGHVLVDKVNNVRIEKLEDLIRAFESSTNAFHAIEFMPSHSLDCMDRAQAEKSNSTILEMYGIPQDRRL